MSDDIVARLRGAEWYCHKSEEHMEFCDKKCASRKLPNPDECRAAADEIERLRGERDGARAEVCLLRAARTEATDVVDQAMADYAVSRGWDDLFKDDA